MTTQQARILVIGFGSSLPLLIRELDGMDIEVISVPDRQSASRVFRSAPSLDVALTSAVLPDGTWQDVLREATRAGAGQLIVCAGPGQVSLWCEVAENKTFNLIAWPLRTGALVEALIRTGLFSSPIIDSRNERHQTYRIRRLTVVGRKAKWPYA